jgi:hypothetical protein
VNCLISHLNNANTLEKINPNPHCLWIIRSYFLETVIRLAKRFLKLKNASGICYKKNFIFNELQMMI